MSERDPRPWVHSPMTEEENEEYRKWVEEVTRCRADRYPLTARQLLELELERGSQ